VTSARPSALTVKATALHVEEDGYTRVLVRSQAAIDYTARQPVVVEKQLTRTAFGGVYMGRYAAISWFSVTFGCCSLTCLFL
jgi:hypothetical protein